MTTDSLRRPKTEQKIRSTSLFFLRGISTVPSAKRNDPRPPLVVVIVNNREPRVVLLLFYQAAINKGFILSYFLANPVTV